MAVAELSREGKIREARRLRAQGWSARKIADFLGANESTVRNWYLGGDCAKCGAPTDGSRSAGKSRHCPSCAQKGARIWTAKVVIDRIREWESINGEPPTVYDWNPWLIKSARRREAFEIFRAGDWPNVSTVQELFGSWNAAIIASGLVPRQPGVRGPDRVKRAVAA